MASGYSDWTRAIRLLGIDDDGNEVTLRVDPDGFLAAVLKGDYEGALRTIMLDDAGRITAFIADAPDQWGNVETVGNAELAARLGFPATWDRRGQILWWTDFRHGLGGLNIAMSGAGAAVEIDPTISLSGGYSVKITNGSNLDKYAQVGVHIDSPINNQLGFYVRWQSLLELETTLLEIKIDSYVDEVLYHAGLQYDRNSGMLYYLDSGEEWSELGAQTFLCEAVTWHNLKLVVDWTTGEYLRAVAGRTEHDMTGLEMYQASDDPAEQLKCTVRLYTEEGATVDLWIDAIAITTNEPV